MCLKCHVSWLQDMYLKCHLYWLQEICLKFCPILYQKMSKFPGVGNVHTMNRKCELSCTFHGISWPGKFRISSSGSNQATAWYIMRHKFSPEHSIEHNSPLHPIIIQEDFILCCCDCLYDTCYRT